MKRKETVVFLILSLMALSVFYTVQTASSKGNPWDQVWETITQIITRIDNLELLEEHVYQIRFTDPTLHVFEDTSWVQAVSFTHIPEESTNNALLNFWFYCEAKSTSVGPKVQPAVEFEIIGSGRPADIPIGYTWSCILSTDTTDPWNGIWYWTRVNYPSNPSTLPNANQDIYTFNIKFRSIGKTEIRNINLIIEVMDGLPPN